MYKCFYKIDILHLRYFISYEFIPIQQLNSIIISSSVESPKAFSCVPWTWLLHCFTLDTLKKRMPDSFLFYYTLCRGSCADLWNGSRESLSCNFRFQAESVLRTQTFSFVWLPFFFPCNEFIQKRRLAMERFFFFPQYFYRLQLPSHS